MKTFLTLAFLFSSAALFGQQQINIPAPPGPSVSVTPVGAQGFTTYYYMVVANYPAGAAQSQIVSVQNGASPLTSGNYNQIGAAALPGALSYDILRLPSNAFTGTCTCSLAVSQSTPNYSDIGGSVSSYTIGAPALAAVATVIIDNTDYGFPKLRLLIGNNPGSLANHLAEVPSGGPGLPAYSTPGDLFVNTGTGNPYQGCYVSVVANAWIPCGQSGSGGLTLNYTVGTGGVVANQPVKLTNTGTVVALLTSDTAPDTAIGIAQQTQPSGASVPVVLIGKTGCISDTGGITAGHLVGVGTTVADTCVDLGTTLISGVPIGVAVLGRALSTVVATASALVNMFPQYGAGNGLLVTCGSTAACPSTSVTPHVVTGTGALVSGTPSTYAVTTISPAFTSAATYTCTAQDTSTIANNIGVLAAGYVSGTAVTFTGPATNTDGFRFTCVGY